MPSACLPPHTQDVWRLEGPEGNVTYRPHGPLYTNSSEVVREAVFSGMGIALRSTWDVRGDLEAGRLVAVLPDYAQPADVWAVFPSRLSVSATLRVCGEFLEDWFAQSGLSEG